MRLIGELFEACKLAQQLLTDNATGYCQQMHVYTRNTLYYYYNIYASMLHNNIMYMYAQKTKSGNVVPFPFIPS